MKQYKYRGWRQMLFIALILLFTLIAAFAAHRNPGADISWWMLLVCLPAQLPLLLAQRRLTEEQWRRQEAEHDERQQLIAGRAALSACTVGTITLLSTMLYLMLREPENETALFALVVVMLVPLCAFLIAQAVWNRKL